MDKSIVRFQLIYLCLHKYFRMPVVLGWYKEAFPYISSTSLEGDMTVVLNGIFLL